MSLARSALFAFTLAAAAAGCRNDRNNEDLQPPEPATKPVEPTSMDTTVTQPETETSASATPADQDDTSDTDVETSGVTGGATLDSDTVNQNASTAPGDAGITDQNRTARGTTSGSGSANPNPPMGQTPPIDEGSATDQRGSGATNATPNEPMQQTPPSDEGSSPDQTPSTDTATPSSGTSSSNGTSTDDTGAGAGAGTPLQPQR